jgi:hypothetical protein
MLLAGSLLTLVNAVASCSCRVLVNLPLAGLVDMPLVGLGLVLGLVLFLGAGLSLGTGLSLVAGLVLVFLVSLLLSVSAFLFFRVNLILIKRSWID